MQSAVGGGDCDSNEPDRSRMSAWFCDERQRSRSANCCHCNWARCCLIGIC